VLTGAIRKQAGRPTRADGRTTSAILVRCAARRGAARPSRGLLMTRHASDRRHEDGSRSAGHGCAAPDLDLPGIERGVLARWTEAEVPGQALARNAGGPGWTCWSEPLAAAGLPGLHDLPAQVAADCYRRLKVMQGFDVSGGTAIAGHGLAVEVAVERELGLSGPADIESYGLDRFTARCRESAARHGAAFAALSARLGCWQAGQPARTTDAGFIESVWWSLRRSFEAGQLQRDDRVTPYCPRCQTPLSSHDLEHPETRPAARGTGVMVRFGLATLPEGANPRLRGADLLGWTAKPWALAANAAIAVHPHQTYALARRSGHEDRVIVAESRLPAMLGEDWHVAARLSGSDLAGATYHPARGLPGGTGPLPVIAGYFVSARAGTGVRPLAPAFGADDLAAATEHGLAVVDPVGPDGRFDTGLPLVGGVFFADASKIVLAALSDAGALFPPVRAADGDARCWRCGTPLLARLMPAWYLRSDATRGSGEGGAGWMISRTRYWGTPLPLWECAGRHVTCVESLAQLSELAGTDVAGLDPHRPLIDEVIIACPRCGCLASRVPDVLDARYDAGWLPFASAVPGRTVFSLANRPHAGLIIANAGPSAGWQEAVRDVSTAVYGHPPDRPVLALEPVRDASGRAMSRGAGNVVEPPVLAGRFGSDVIRWFCLARPSVVTGPPTEAALEEICATVFAPYWRATTAVLGSAAPATGAAPPAEERPEHDQELLRASSSLIGDVTAGFEALGPSTACARMAGFIDALANGYLPGAEARLAPGGPAAGQPDAWRDATAATLRECLDVLTRLMAPVAPVITDEVWNRLRELDHRPDVPGSVHLASWPGSGPGSLS
jgi:isoleucyl-tRNA synthetase